LAGGSGKKRSVVRIITEGDPGDEKEWGIKIVIIETFSQAVQGAGWGVKKSFMEPRESHIPRRTLP